jgi:acetoin utilization deacetylase AcuC-like enzyme
MIAVMRLLDEKAVQNVLIVDGDAHDGDGTRNIIRRMHVGPQVTNHDRVSFDRFTRPHWNLHEWLVYFDNLLRGSRAGIIMYQAGADAWEYDPLGAGYLSKEALATRDRALFIAAKDRGIPLVWNLAGGYADPMQDTIDIHLQTLAISDEVYYGRKRTQLSTQDVQPESGAIAG